MDLIIRATVLYLFVLFILQVTGKRTLNEITTFDFVLLLIISEAVDNSIIGPDQSLTSTILVIITLIVLEIILSFLKQKFKTLDVWLEGAPLIIAENGKIIKKRANKEKIDEEDVLSAARLIHGLERMEQIKYAILEKNGGISIIPK